MDIEEIKTLTDLMVENDLSEVMIRDGDKRIVLRRGGGGMVQYAAAPVGAAAPAPAPAQPPALPQTPTADGDPADDADLCRITSPMVGTFYAGSDPDAPPFVQVGDTIGPDTVICLIEAMKVFNEIKAEVSGVIESIDVQNAEPVEFGQSVMTVRKS